MVNLLNIIFMSATVIAVHGQTGTCCYNAQCAIPNFQPWNPFNLTRGTGVTDSATNINAVSCCPSGGDVFGKFNDGSAADALCRCYDSGFIEQTCPYTQSDALQCDNVGSDDGCPDLMGLGGTATNNGAVSCLIGSSNGIHYVPQRCPTRLLCLNGLSRFEGVYYTNSSLYYYGAPFYWFRDTDYLRFQIRYDRTDLHWKLIQWIGADGTEEALLPADYSGAEDYRWDIIDVQLYADYWGNGWWVFNDATQQYERTDAVYLTEGECPTTSAPTKVPTKAPTATVTVTPAVTGTGTTTQPTLPPTAADTTRIQSGTAAKSAAGYSCYISAFIMFYFIY